MRNRAKPNREEMHVPPADTRISRRRFLRMGAGAAAGALLLPAYPEAAGAGALVDPYNGAIPLVFPLVYGTYETPVQDNWQVNREGQTYAWNHQNGSSQRAHNGVDIHPARRRKLPRGSTRRSRVR